MYRKHIIYKIISVVLILVFIHEQIGWTQGGRPVWAEAREYVSTYRDKLDTSNIDIPYDIAEKQDVLINGTGEIIINIQDAHASLSAQYSIANLLDSLATNYDLSLIAVEGASGYVDTSILKTFPDKEKRDKTAKELMAEGRMSAGEFFAVTHDETEVSLYGVEESELYRANLDSFRSVAANRAERIANVNALLKELDSLGEKVFSKDFRDLNEKCLLHREGKLTFTGYWEYIKDFAGKKKIAKPEGKELAKLLEAVGLEKSINFSRANDERRILIDELSEKMDKSGLEELVKRSIAFKDQKISQGEFYSYLLRLPEKYGIGPEKYTNLIAFAKYIALYESIEIFRLYHEIEAFEDGIRQELYRTSDEIELYRIIKMVRLVKQLYSMELTNGEYEYIKTNHNGINASGVSAFLRDKCNKYKIAIEGSYDLSSIFGGIDEALSFYEKAEMRNAAMLTNTVRRMRAEGKRVAALITGGYHTKGLASLMREKGLSYLVVTPKFEDGKERPYIAILTNKKKAYEKVLETGKYELAAELFFQDVQDTSDGAKRMDFILRRLFPGEERIPDESARIWIEAYKNTYQRHVDSLPEEDMAKKMTPEEFEKEIMKRAEGEVSVKQAPEEEAPAVSTGEKETEKKTPAEKRPMGIKGLMIAYWVSLGIMGLSIIDVICWVEGAAPLTVYCAFSIMSAVYVAAQVIIALGIDKAFRKIGIKIYADEIAWTEKKKIVVTPAFYVLSKPIQKLVLIHEKLHTSGHGETAAYALAPFLLVLYIAFPSLSWFKEMEPSKIILREEDKEEEWQIRKLNPRLDAEILKKTPPFKKRYITISDLHGIYPAELRRMLRSVGFISSKDEIIARNTVVVIGGDTIDRGPVSLELYKYVRYLQEEAQKTGCEVIRLLGNHEQMLYDGMRGNDESLLLWVYNLYRSGDEWGIDAFDYFYTQKAYYSADTGQGKADKETSEKLAVSGLREKIRMNTKWGEVSRLLAEDIEEGKFKAAHECNNVLFVHGGTTNALANYLTIVKKGYSAKLAADALNEEFRQHVEKEGNLSRLSRLRQALWDRFTGKRLPSHDDLNPAERNIVNGSGIDYLMVVGHASAKQNGRIRVSPYGNVINVDTGHIDAWGADHGFLVIEGNDFWAVELKQPQEETTREFITRTTEKRPGIKEKLEKVRTAINEKKYGEAGREIMKLVRELEFILTYSNSIRVNELNELREKSMTISEEYSEHLEISLIEDFVAEIREATYKFISSHEKAFSLEEMREIESFLSKRFDELKENWAEDAEAREILREIISETISFVIKHDSLYPNERNEFEAQLKELFSGYKGNDSQGALAVKALKSLMARINREEERIFDPLIFLREQAETIKRIAEKLADPRLAIDPRQVRLFMKEEMFPGERAEDLNGKVRERIAGLIMPEIIPTQKKDMIVGVRYRAFLEEIKKEYDKILAGRTAKYEKLRKAFGSVRNALKKTRKFIRRNRFLIAIGITLAASIMQALGINALGEGVFASGVMMAAGSGEEDNGEKEADDAKKPKEKPELPVHEAGHIAPFSLADKAEEAVPVPHGWIAKAWDVIGRALPGGKTETHKDIVARVISNTAHQDTEDFAIDVLEEGEESELLISTRKRQDIDRRVEEMIEEVCRAADIKDMNALQLQHVYEIPVTDYNDRRITVKVYCYKPKNNYVIEKATDRIRQAAGNYRGKTSIPSYTTSGLFARLRINGGNAVVPQKDSLKNLPEGMTGSDSFLPRIAYAIAKIEKNIEKMGEDTDLETPGMTDLYSILQEFSKTEAQAGVGAYKRLAGIIREKLVEVQRNIKNAEEEIIRIKKTSQEGVDPREIERKITLQTKIKDGAVMTEDKLRQLWYYINNPRGDYMAESLRIEKAGETRAPSRTPLVLIVDNLTPSQLDYIVNNHYVEAFVTKKATITSHWVIAAKNKNIPVAILDMPPILEQYNKEPADQITVEKDFIHKRMVLIRSDANHSAEVVFAPSMVDCRSFRDTLLQEEAFWEFVQAEMEEIVSGGNDQPWRDIKLEGTEAEISLLVNADTPEDIRKAREENHAGGVGLVRTEYLFSSDGAIDENGERPLVDYLERFFGVKKNPEKPEKTLKELRESSFLYKKTREALKEKMVKDFVALSEAAAGAPVTIRTIDFQLDDPGKETLIHKYLKTADYARKLFAMCEEEGLTQKVESGVDFYKNPLGREILQLQLEAAMEAYLISKEKNIKIMFPMISTIAGVDRLISNPDSVLMHAKMRALKDTKQEGADETSFDAIPIGIMVETDMAVRNISELVARKEISFYSIGTNDISRYLMAYVRIIEQYIERYIEKLKSKSHNIDKSKISDRVRTELSLNYGESVNYEDFLIHLMNVARYIKKYKSEHDDKDPEIGEIVKAFKGKQYESFPKLDEVVVEPLNRDDPDNAKYTTTLQQAVLIAITIVLGTIATYNENKAPDERKELSICGEMGSWYNFQVFLVKKLMKLDIVPGQVPLSLSMARGRIPAVNVFIRGIKEHHLETVDTFLEPGKDIFGAIPVDQMADGVVERVFEDIFAQENGDRISVPKMYEKLKQELATKGINELKTPDERRKRTLYTLELLTRLGGPEAVGETLPTDIKGDFPVSSKLDEEAIAKRGREILTELAKKKAQKTEDSALKAAETFVIRSNQGLHPRPACAIIDKAEEYGVLLKYIAYKPEGEAAEEAGDILLRTSDDKYPDRLYGTRALLEKSLLELEATGERAREFLDALTSDDIGVYDTDPLTDTVMKFMEVSEEKLSPERYKEEPGQPGEKLPISTRGLILSGLFSLFCTLIVTVLACLVAEIIKQHYLWIFIIASGFIFHFAYKFGKDWQLADVIIRAYETAKIAPEEVYPAWTEDETIHVFVNVYDEISKEFQVKIHTHEKAHVFLNRLLKKVGLRQGKVLTAINHFAAYQFPWLGRFAKDVKTQPEFYRRKPVAPSETKTNWVIEVITVCGVLLIFGAAFIYMGYKAGEQLIRKALYAVRIRRDLESDDEKSAGYYLEGLWLCYQNRFAEAIDSFGKALKTRDPSREFDFTSGTREYKEAWIMVDRIKAYIDRIIASGRHEECKQIWKRCADNDAVFIMIERIYDQDYSRKTIINKMRKRLVKGEVSWRQNILFAPGELDLEEGDILLEKETGEVYWCHVNETDTVTNAINFASSSSEGTLRITINKELPMLFEPDDERDLRNRIKRAFVKLAPSTIGSSLNVINIDNEQERAKLISELVEKESEKGDKSVESVIRRMVLEDLLNCSESEDLRRTIIDAIKALANRDNPGDEEMRVLLAEYLLEEKDINLGDIRPLFSGDKASPHQRKKVISTIIEKATKFNQEEVRALLAGQLVHTVVTGLKKLKIHHKVTIRSTEKILSALTRHTSASQPEEVRSLIVRSLIDDVEFSSAGHIEAERFAEIIEIIKGIEESFHALAVILEGRNPALRKTAVKLITELDDKPGNKEIKEFLERKTKTESKIKSIFRMMRGTTKSSRFIKVLIYLAIAALCGMAPMMVIMPSEEIRSFKDFDNEFEVIEMLHRHVPDGYGMDTVGATIFKVRYLGETVELVTGGILKKGSVCVLKTATDDEFIVPQGQLLAKTLNPGNRSLHVPKLYGLVEKIENTAIGEENGLKGTGLLLEFIEGETLDKYLKKLRLEEPRVKEEKSIRLALELFENYKRIYVDNGCVNGDLDPTGIIIRESASGEGIVPVFIDNATVIKLRKAYTSQEAKRRMVAKAKYLNPDRRRRIEDHFTADELCKTRDDIYSLCVILLSNLAPAPLDTLYRDKGAYPPNEGKFRHLIGILAKYMQKAQDENQYFTAGDIIEEIKGIMPGEESDTKEDFLERIEAQLLDLGMNTLEVGWHLTRIGSILEAEGEEAATLELERLKDPYRVGRIEAGFEDVVRDFLKVTDKKLSEMDDKDLKQLIKEFLAALQRKERGWNASPAFKKLFEKMLNEYLRKDQIEIYKTCYGHFDVKDLVLVLQRLHSLTEDMPRYGMREEALPEFTLVKLLSNMALISKATYYNEMKKAGFMPAEWGTVTIDEDLEKWLDGPGDKTFYISDTNDREEHKRFVKTIAQHYGIDLLKLEKNFIYVHTLAQQQKEKDLSERLDDPYGVHIHLLGHMKQVLEKVLEVRYDLRKDGYDIEEFIGRGYDGIVFKGKGPQGNSVTIKINFTNDYLVFGVKGVRDPFSVADKFMKLAEITGDNRNLAKIKKIKRVPVRDDVVVVEIRQYTPEGYVLMDGVARRDFRKMGLAESLDAAVQFLESEKSLMDRSFVDTDAPNLENYIMSPEEDLTRIDYGNVKEQSELGDLSTIQVVRCRQVAILTALRILTGQLWFELAPGTKQPTLEIFANIFGEEYKTVAKGIFEDMEEAWESDDKDIAKVFQRLIDKLKARKEAVFPGQDLLEANEATSTPKININKPGLLITGIDRFHEEPDEEYYERLRSVLRDGLKPRKDIPRELLKRHHPLSVPDFVSLSMVGKSRGYAGTWACISIYAPNPNLSRPDKIPKEKIAFIINPDYVKEHPEAFKAVGPFFKENSEHFADYTDEEGTIFGGIQYSEPPLRMVISPTVEPIDAMKDEVWSEAIPADAIIGAIVYKEHAEEFRDLIVDGFPGKVIQVFDPNGKLLFDTGIGSKDSGEAEASRKGLGIILRNICKYPLIFVLMYGLVDFLIGETARGNLALTIVNISITFFATGVAMVRVFKDSGDDYIDDEPGSKGAGFDLAEEEESVEEEDEKWEWAMSENAEEVADFFLELFKKNPALLGKTILTKELHSELNNFLRREFSETRFMETLDCVFNTVYCSGEFTDKKCKKVIINGIKPYRKKRREAPAVSPLSKPRAPLGSYILKFSDYEWQLYRRFALKTGLDELMPNLTGGNWDQFFRTLEAAEALENMGASIKEFEARIRNVKTGVEGHPTTGLEADMVITVDEGDKRKRYLVEHKESGTKALGAVISTFFKEPEGKFSQWERYKITAKNKKGPDHKRIYDGVILACERREASRFPSSEMIPLSAILEKSSLTADKKEAIKKKAEITESVEEEMFHVFTYRTTKPSKPTATIKSIKDWMAPEMNDEEYALRIAPRLEEAIFFLIPMLIGHFAFGIDSLWTVCLMALARGVFFFMHEGAREHAPPEKYEIPLAVSVSGFTLSILPIFFSALLLNPFIVILFLTFAAITGHWAANKFAITRQLTPAAISLEGDPEKNFQEALIKLKEGTTEEKIDACSQLAEIGRTEAIRHIIKAGSGYGVDSRLKIAVIDALATLKRVPLKKRETTEIGSSIPGIINSVLSEMGISEDSVRICGPYEKIRIKFDLSDSPKNKIHRLETLLREKFGLAHINANFYICDPETLVIEFQLSVENLTAFWRALGTMDLKVDEEGNYRKFTMVELVGKIKERTQMLLDGMELELDMLDATLPEDAGKYEDPKLYEKYRSLYFFVYGDGTNTNPGLINIMQDPEKMRAISDSEDMTRYKGEREASKVKQVDGKRYVSYGDSQLLKVESVKGRMNYCSVNDMITMAESNPYFVNYLEHVYEEKYGADGIKRWIYLARAAGSVFQTAYTMDIIRNQESSDNMFFISQDTVSPYDLYGARIASLVGHSGDDPDKDFQWLESIIMKDLDNKYTEREEKWRELLDSIWGQLETSCILEGVKAGEHIMVVDEIANGTYDFMFKYIVEKKTLEKDQERYQKELQELCERGEGENGAEKGKIRPPQPIYVDIFVGKPRTAEIRGYPRMEAGKIMEDFGLTRSQAFEIIEAISTVADFMPHPVKVSDDIKPPVLDSDFPIQLEENDVLVSSYLKALLGVNGIIEYHDTICFNPIVAMLKSDNDPEVRKAAISALVKFDYADMAERAKKVLIEISSEESDPFVRGAAANAVISIIVRQLGDSIRFHESGIVEVLDIRELMKRIDVIMAAVDSPYAPAREFALHMISVISPEFFNLVSSKRSTLPVSSKPIMDAARKNNFAVPAINIGLGKISLHLQAEAVLKAARDMNATVGFSIFAEDFENFDYEKELLPVEWTAEVAENVFDETDPVYFYHFEYTGVTEFDNQQFARSKNLITRALEQGYTSISIDCSSLSIEGKVYAKGKDPNAKGAFQGIFRKVDAKKESGALYEKFELLKENTATQKWESIGTITMKDGEVVEVPQSMEHWGAQNILVDRQLSARERLEHVIKATAELYYHTIKEARRLEMSIGIGAVLDEAGAGRTFYSKEQRTFKKTITLPEDVSAFLKGVTEAVNRRLRFEQEIDIPFDTIAIDNGLSYGYKFDRDDRLVPQGEKEVDLERTAMLAELAKVGITQHGFSGTKPDVAGAFPSKGISKVNASHEWNAIVWRVLEAYCPDVYQKVFRASRERAIIENAPFVTGDADADFWKAKNRIVFGYANKVFSEASRKGDYELINKVKDSLQNSTRRMNITGEIPEDIPATYIVHDMQLKDDNKGLLAVELIQLLTYRKARRIFKIMNCARSSMKIVEEGDRLLGAQLSDLFHREYIFTSIGTTNFEEATSDVFERIIKAHGRNKNTERPTISLFLGAQACGKRSVLRDITQRLADSPADGKPRIHDISMEDGWLVGHSRRHDTSIFGNYDLTGRLGFRDFLRNIRAGGDGYRAFFNRNTRKRCRLVNMEKFVSGDIEYVDETTATREIRELIKRLKEAGAQEFRIQEVTLLKIFDDAGNYLIEDKDLCEELEESLNPVLKEKEEDPYFERKNLFIDITERKDGAFITGDIVERITPAENDIFLITSRVAGNDKVFLPEEREELFDVVMGIWAPPELRKIKLIQQMRTGLIYRYVPENVILSMFDKKMITEEMTQIDPTLWNADVVLLNTSTFEDLIISEELREKLPNALLKKAYAVLTDYLVRSGKPELSQKEKLKIGAILSEYAQEARQNGIIEKMAAMVKGLQDEVIRPGLMEARKPLKEEKPILVGLSMEVFGELNEKDLEELTELAVQVAFPEGASRAEMLDDLEKARERMSLDIAVLIDVDDGAENVMDLIRNFVKTAREEMAPLSDPEVTPVLDDDSSRQIEELAARIKSIEPELGSIVSMDLALSIYQNRIHKRYNLFCDEGRREAYIENLDEMKEEHYLVSYADGADVLSGNSNLIVPPGVEIGRRRKKMNVGMNTDKQYDKFFVVAPEEGMTEDQMRSFKKILAKLWMLENIVIDDNIVILPRKEKGGSYATSELFTILSERTGGRAKKDNTGFRCMIARKDESEEQLRYDDSEILQIELSYGSRSNVHQYEFFVTQLISKAWKEWRRDNSLEELAPLIFMPETILPVDLEEEIRKYYDRITREILVRA